jgi:hypothetical protein
LSLPRDAISAHIRKFGGDKKFRAFAMACAASELLSKRVEESERSEGDDVNRDGQRCLVVPTKVGAALSLVS